MSISAIRTTLIGATLSIFILLFAGATFAQDTNSDVRAPNMNEMWSSNRDDVTLQESFIFNGNPEQILTVVITNHDLDSGLITTITNLNTGNIISSGNVQPGAQIICIPPTDEMFMLEIFLDDTGATGGYDAIVTDRANTACSSDFINTLIDEGNSLIDDAQSDETDESALPIPSPNDVVVDVVDNVANAVMMTENLSLNNATALLNVDVVLTGNDALAIDGDLISTEDGLQLTTLITDANGNLLDVTVNVLGDEEALADVDLLNNDLVSVYLYDDENGLVLDVILGDETGVVIDDALDMIDNFGLDTLVGLTDNGLLIDLDVTENDVLTVDVSDDAFALDILNNTIVSTEDNPIGSVNLSENLSLLDESNFLTVDLALTGDDSFTIDGDLVSTDDGLQLTALITDDNGNFLDVTVNVLSDEEALADVDLLNNDLVSVYLYDDENGLVLDIILGDETGIVIDDALDMVDNFGLDTLVGLTNNGLLIDLDVTENDVLTVDVSDDVFALDLLNNNIVNTDGSEFVSSSSSTTCEATPNTRFASFNVRTLPSVGADVLATWSSDENLIVTGTALDDTWLQVDLLNDNVGYVSSSILNLADVCVVTDLDEITVDVDLITQLDLEAQASALSDDLTETVDDITDTATDAVNDTANDVADAVDDVADTTDNTVDDVADTVDDVQDTVDDTTDDVSNTVDDTIGGLGGN
ncbi:MAG: SH3 domain-containing protein [Chloroflexota bacterium]